MEMWSTVVADNISDVESDVDENSEKIFVHKPPSWRDVNLTNIIRELDDLKKSEETPRRVKGPVSERKRSEQL